MSKKFLFLISFVAVLSLASTSYGTDPCVIGNWEDVMDGWEVNDINVTTAYSTIGVTLDTRSLKVMDNLLGVPLGGNDGAIWYTLVADGNDVNDVNAFKYNIQLKADITRRASEWMPIFASFSNIGIAINAGGTGWDLWYAAAEGGGWQPELGDSPITYTYDYSGALSQIDFDNLDYLQIFFNTWWGDYNPGGTYYLDNVRLLGGGPAYAPYPGNGQMGVPLDANLYWTPGAYDANHDVYFGNSFTDVNNADISDITGVYRGRQDANTYDPCAGLLHAGMTYYWRIDEVNLAHDPTMYRGDVLHFTAAATTTIIGDWEDVCDVYTYDGWGNGSQGPETYFDYNNNPNGVTLHEHSLAVYVQPDNYWTFARPGLIDLNNMTLRLDVTMIASEWPSENWLKVDKLVVESDLDPGWREYAASAISRITGQKCPLDWGHAGAVDVYRTYSWDFTGPEVQEPKATYNDWADATWMTIEIALQNTGGEADGAFYMDNARLVDARYATDPKPVDKEADAPINPVLSWKMGVDATDHDLYFGPNEVNVADADHTDPEFKGNIDSQDVRVDLCYYTLGSFNPNDANYYYWRIDANNPASGLLKGDVWRFKIDNLYGVDNFDPYTSDGGYGVPGDLTHVWKPNPGSDAYYAELETSVSRDGKSMKYTYGYYTGPYYFSEIDADVCDLPSAVGQNWNAIGAKALQLYFYGKATNDANEQMYVKLTHGATTKKVMYDGDMNNIRNERWQEWNIPLAEFTGIDLNDVNTITIGFGDTNDPFPALGTGIVYFDDIHLYPRRCRPEMTTADVDGDCFVDYNDLEIMADNWLDQGESVPSTDPGDANLVLYHPLNEGNWAIASTDDASVYDNNGLKRGNPVWVASSPQGSYAMDFNGLKDYLLVNTATELHPTKAVSLSVWVKTNDCGNLEVNPYIHNQAYKLWNTSGNNIEFTVHTATPDDFSAVFPVDESFNGVWHHLAGTFDRSHVKLYVDSVLKDTVDLDPAADLSTNFQKIIIASTTVTTERYSGILDEARIYNKALSAEEVGYLATNGTGHLPLTSPANLYNVAPTIINFKDFAMLADGWLEEQLWP